MTKRSPVILLGNGPNRLEDRVGNPSWDALMRDLAARTGHSAFQTGRKPLPLAFEEVLGRAARVSEITEADLKDHVAGVARRVHPNWFHDSIASLPVSEVLTTNYDYTLLPEYSGVEVTPGSTETKYSLFRRHRARGQWVWYIHGEASAPDTLLLGHDHYVRYSGRIQEYLRQSEGVADPEKWKVSTATSPLSAGISEFETLEPTPSGYPRYSWVDLFLTREMHIVGLGLDFSEIILWWLLTVRARREEQRKHGTKKEFNPDGPVVWWECGKDANEPSYADRREVAEALGVETRFVPIGPQGYPEAYRQILANLSARIST